jgi:catechol 2,3-dioxygenase-like lactoylglutathione lyase family enzyme
VDARIDVITLAVEDFERAFAFYHALGFESKGVVATEFTRDDTRPAGAIAMVHLQGGQILSLYPRGELAKDAGIPRGPAQSGEFSLGHIVATRDEVEALLAKAAAAGRPSPSCMTAPGASPPATSATPTDTSGKSSTTETARTATPDRNAADSWRIAEQVRGYGHSNRHFQECQNVQRDAWECLWASR